jgi:hypothetical protein
MACRAARRMKRRSYRFDGRSWDVYKDQWCVSNTRLVVTDERGRETAYEEGDLFLHADGRVFRVRDIYANRRTNAPFLRAQLVAEAGLYEVCLTNSWTVLRHDIADRVVGRIDDRGWRGRYAGRDGSPLAVGSDRAVYLRHRNYTTVPGRCMTPGERQRTRRRARATTDAVLAFVVAAHPRLGKRSPAGRLDRALLARIALMARPRPCRCCGRWVPADRLASAESAAVRGFDAAAELVCDRCARDEHVCVAERCGTLGCTWYCPYHE